MGQQAIPPLVINGLYTGQRENPDSRGRYFGFIRDLDRGFSWSAYGTEELEPNTRGHFEVIPNGVMEDVVAGKNRFAQFTGSYKPLSPKEMEAAWEAGKKANQELQIDVNRPRMQDLTPEQIKERQDKGAALGALRRQQALSEQISKAVAAAAPKVEATVT